MRSLIVLVLVLPLAGATGCSPGMAVSGAKAGVSVVRGAQAEVLPVRAVSPRAIAPYTALVLGQVTTDVGPVCPPECVAVVKLALTERFADEKTKKHFPGGGQRLVVDVVCRYFQAKHFLGADPRLHLLAILKDGQSQEEIGRYYVAGVSESALADKVEDLAKANAKALCETLANRKMGKMDD